MSALRHKETLELIRSLEAQGARIQWAKSSSRSSSERVGAFPVKVWPPDPDKHFILLHDTVSSPNDVIVKRTEVQRAGLLWPFDNKKATKALEKSVARENPTPTTPPIPPEETDVSAAAAVDVTESTTPMQHVRTPPGARNFPVPTPESLGPFADALTNFQDGSTFWTADVTAILQMRGVPGYKGNSGTGRAQGMLDFLGYRVVEYKKNRSGYAYRWKKDPNAEVGQPQSVAERSMRAAETRKAKGIKSGPTPGARKEARGKTWVPPTPAVANAITDLQSPAVKPATAVGSALVDAMLLREAEASIALDKGEVQTLSDKKAHERKRCTECNRWFTPEGYDRHVSDTGHDGHEKTTVPQGGQTETGAGPEASGVTSAAGTAPSFTPDPDESLPWPERPDTDGVVHYVERGGLPVDMVPKADYEVMERMAQETEAKLAAALDQVRRLEEGSAALIEDLAAERRERDQLRADLEKVTQHARYGETLIDTLKEQVALLDQAVRPDDDSWTIEPARHLTFGTLIEQATTMGVTLEVRARRKGNE